MQILKVGTIDLLTGKESIVALPYGMDPCEADSWCRKNLPGERFWFCSQPTVKRTTVYVVYDYYIIVMPKPYIQALSKVASGMSVESFVRQSLRSRGLLDENDDLTFCGKYVLDVIKPFLTFDKLT